MLISGVLLVGTLGSSPAFAEGTTPDPTPTATESPIPTAEPTPDAVAPSSGAAQEVTLAGSIVDIPVEPGSTNVIPSNEKIFRTIGLGYLPIDVSGIDPALLEHAAIELTVTVPAGLDLGTGPEEEFRALQAFSIDHGAIPVTSVATSDPRLMGATNQTPATAAVHKVYAVLVNPYNYASATAQPNQTVARVQAAVTHASNYWSAQSNGAITFEYKGTVAHYKAAAGGVCNTQTGSSALWAEAATKAQQQLGYKDALNTHLALFFPSDTTCGGWLGLGSVGGSINFGGVSWSIGTDTPTAKATFAHELGHNLSFGHATWLDCATATPNPGITGYVAVGGTVAYPGCVRRDYGDIYDVMGFGMPDRSGGSLSSAQAIRASIWPASAYVDAPVGTTTYTLNDVGSYTGLRSVVVEDNLGVNYFVEFRNYAGAHDAQYAAQGCTVNPNSWCMPAGAGVRILRLENGAYNGSAVKGSPGDDSFLVGRVIGGIKKTAFTKDESYSTAGMTITVNSAAGSSATVTVTRPPVAVASGAVRILESVGDGWPWNAGDTLTALVGASWKANSYAFTWYRNNTAIAGATGRNYVLQAADIGKGIKVRLTGGSSSATDPASSSSSGYGPIAAGNVIAGTVSIVPAANGLLATPADWLTPGTVMTYQWYRDNVAISGATAALYKPVAADRDKQLKVLARGSKSGSAAATALSLAGNYSVNSAGILAVSGDGKVGVTLSVNALSYSTTQTPADPTVTRSYQWLRTGVAIAGATSATYRTVAADLNKAITVRVVATVAGFAPHTSTAPTAVPIALPGDIDMTSAVPVVSKTGLALSAQFPNGTIAETNPIPTVVWQWLRDDALITGATKATYALVAADQGKLISVRATLTKPAFIPVVRTSAPVNHSLLASGMPTIGGVQSVGRILSATPPTYSTSPATAGSATVAYQWFRAGVAIPLATTSTYTLVAADYNKAITVRTIGAKDGYLPATGVSTNTALIAKGTIQGSLAQPTISRSGLVLTASAASSITEPGTVSGYQWYRAGVAVAGATKATYALTALDRLKAVHVSVTVTKLNYTTVTLHSTPHDYTVTVNGPTLTTSGALQVGGVLTVNETTYTTIDGAQPVTVTRQWYRAGVAVAGATGTTYPLLAADYAKVINVVVTATATGYIPSVVTVASAPVAKGVIGGSWADPVVTKSGLTLTATLAAGTITEAGTVTTWQWLRNGVAIAGATKPAFAVTVLDRDKTISVRATVTKLNYSTVSLVSPAIDYTVKRGVALDYSGTIRVGGSVTANSSSFTNYGDTAPTPAYQWLRAGIVIPNATGETYLPVAADLGKALSVRVTAAAVGYIAYLGTSPAKVVAPGQLATPYTVPVVQRSGKTLTLASLGSVGDATGVTYGYQWYRSGVAIAGATKTSYTLVAADAGKTITVRQLASRVAYTAVPLLSQAVNYSLQRTAAPAIVGTARVAETLSVNAGEFFLYNEGSVEDTAPAYQWYRSGVAIAGATGPSYTVVPADLAKLITVRLYKVQEPHLPYLVTSPATTAVLPGIIQGSQAVPTISKDDATLILTATEDPAAVTELGTTRSWQWFRAGVAIPKATLATFKVTAIDYNKAITVRRTVSKAGYSSLLLNSAAANTSVVPISAPLPVITGDVAIGRELSVAQRSYSNGGTETLQWLRNGVAIANAISATYTPVALDKGKAISVRVTAGSYGFLPSISTSAATQLVNTLPLAGGASTTPVAVSNNSVAPSFTLTAGATGVTEDPVTKTYQWYRAGVAIAGATKVSYVPVAADYNKALSVRVVHTKLNYTTVITWSAAVNYSLLAGGLPVLSSTIPAVGTTLGATAPSFTVNGSAATATAAYAWLRNGVAIAGAVNPTYTTVALDKAKKISVRVTYRANGALPVTLTSGVTALVTP